MSVLPRTTGSRISSGLLPSWNPGMRRQFLSPASNTSSLPMRLRQPQRLFGGRHRDERLGAMRQRGAHDRGSAENVDDENRPTLYVRCGKPGWREDDVELHTSCRKSCGCRSRNLVSTFPATKSG